ncbi:MAG: hypothetical protein DRG31_01475 [Deltaproteobacteria bacterium]|nr:MAG: hypothetical protein DRG31_01475 [Deltaproteobacteria bacterium]
MGGLGGEGRRFLVLGILLAVIFVAFWQFSYKPQKERITQKERQLEKLRRERDRKRKLAAQLEKYRAELKEIEKKLTQITSRLPEEKEIPVLLKTISFVGKGVGLRIESFRPREEKQGEFFAEVPFEMDLAGGYHQIGMFFYQVGRLPRIVTIKDFSFRPLEQEPGTGSVILKAHCTGATYYFLPQPKVKPKAQAESKKVKRKKKSRR